MNLIKRLWLEIRFRYTLWRGVRKLRKEVSQITYGETDRTLIGIEAMLEEMK